MTAFHLSARQTGQALGLGLETTARILAAGLAGEPVRGLCEDLYPRAVVEALRDRPVLDHTLLLPQGCRRGVLVSRTDPRTSATAAGPWRLGPARRATLAALLADHGRIPLVTTVGGFVTGGADVTATRVTVDGRVTLELGPPGPWFETFRDTQLPLTPGDRLLFWRCPWLPPVRGRVRRARPRADAGR